MATLIKDIAISSATSFVTDKALDEFRSFPGVNKAVNALAGFPDFDANNAGKGLPNKASAKVSYPIDIEQNAEFSTYMEFNVNEHKFKSAREKAQVLERNTVILNVPNQLSTIYEKRWAQDELGAAESIAAGNAAGGIVEAAMRGGKQILATGKEKAIASIAGGVGLSGGEGAVQKQRQSVINPNLALLFKGINFRVFTFSFLFQPRNEAELMEALAIIKVFKYWSAPYYEDGKSLIHYPALFNIKFMAKNTASASENQHLFKFKPCACTSVAVDYSPNSIWATFKNGAPVAFRMDVTFTEDDIITRQDIFNPSKPKDVGA